MPDFLCTLFVHPPFTVLFFMTLRSHLDRFCGLRAMDPDPPRQRRSRFSSSSFIYLRASVFLHFLHHRAGNLHLLVLTEL